MLQNSIFHPIILKFCLLGALARFVLIYSTMIIYFASIGLNPALIGMVLTIYEIGKISGDVVFATIADKYGRKLVIILGFLTKAAGIISWIISPNVFGAFVGAVLFGTGKAGTNTIESYMYDELKANEIGRNFRDSLALKSIVVNLSASFGGYCASILYKLGGFNYIFIASIFVIIFISVPYTIFFLKDQMLYTKGNKGKNIITVGIDGFLYTWNNKKIFYTIILVSIFYSAFIIYTDTNKMIMNNIGLTPDVIAQIYAIAHLIPAITTLIFLCLRPGMLIRGIIIISITMWIGIGVTAYFMYGKPVISAILLYLFLFPIFDTCIRDNVHRLILNSSIRSTIIAFSHLISAILNMISSLMIGFIAHKYSYSIALTVFSILLVILTIFAMVLQKINAIDRRKSVLI